MRGGCRGKLAQNFQPKNLPPKKIANRRVEDLIHTDLERPGPFDFFLGRRSRPEPRKLTSNQWVGDTNPLLLHAYPLRGAQWVALWVEIGALMARLGLERS